MSLQTDILIIGAGVLGSSLAYEISAVSDIKVTLVDMESAPAMHSSSRNTGVVHRPFYLNPKDKAVYARSANESYGAWKELAGKFGLPWVQRGVLELALNDRDVGVIEKYYRWALDNGMSEEEVKILDREGLKVEPLVSAEGAILSTMDANVSYGEMVRAIVELAEGNGVKTLWGCNVVKIRESSASCILNDELKEIRAKLIVNASGGGSYRLARSMGLASEYSEMHFRGDYWLVRGFNGVNRNIYTVPRNPGYPFLDPHFIIRPNGQAEIGPNAFLVSGPFSYTGTVSEILKSASILRDRRVLGLLLDREMLGLIWNDWRMSISKSSMVRRVKHFIPSLNASYAYERGTSGIRHNLVSKDGFVPEAVVIGTPSTVHILNYNSPGATGAPAFALALLSQLMKQYGIKISRNRAPVWNDLLSKLETYSIELKIHAQ